MNQFKDVTDVVSFLYHTAMCDEILIDNKGYVYGKRTNKEELKFVWNDRKRVWELV